MKTIKLLVLTALLLAPAVSLAAFQDVGSSHLNRDAIDYVKNQGIVGGYPDGSYQPERSINRAEFTKIVIEAQYEAEVIDDCLSTIEKELFSDVDKEQWFSKYVCMAYVRGIIEGYPDGTFRPAQNISFVEAAKIIISTLGYSVGSDAVWYKPFVERLGMEGAIPTTIDRFEKNVTRGEMAEMIYRLKATIRDKSTKTYNALAGLAEPELAEAMQWQGKVIAGNSTTPFLEFKQEDYEAALEAGKQVVLYFYASWCPLCRNEVNNSTYPAFNELMEPNLVGFRVNFNDGDTDDDEEELAREFGVAYQHTKVFLKNGERVLKSPELWNKERYLEEIASFLE